MWGILHSSRRLSRLGRLCVFGCRSAYTDTSQRQLLAASVGGSVDLHKDDSKGLAVVTLNSPERRNAFTGKMMLDLRDIVDELDDWKEGRAVVLQGAGGNLCSGADLELVRALCASGKGPQMCIFMQQTLNRLFLLPLVSTALVQGVALGGGAELAVACDYRVMKVDAKVGYVQARMGVSPGWGGGARLVQLLGRTTALHLMLSARIIPSDEALAIGFSQGTLPEEGDDDALKQTTDWLESRLGSSSPEILQAQKKVVVNACGAELQQLMQGEKDIFASVWGGPAQRLALAGNLKHK